MGDVVVRMDGQAVQRLLESPNGPVMRHVAQRATAVKQRAQQIVRVSDPAQRTSRSGQGQHLRDTIVTRFVTDPSGPSIWVGSNLPHALIEHEGTRPHVILPKKAKVLRFPVRGGGIVFAKRVNHPGTTGSFFLVRAAQEVGLRIRGLARGPR